MGQRPHFCGNFERGNIEGLGNYPLNWVSDYLGHAVFVGITGRGRRVARPYEIMVII